jgi:hypothetical protein
MGEKKAENKDGNIFPSNHEEVKDKLLLITLIILG